MGDGDISVLISISSFASENELEFLQQEFENDDYSKIIENEYLALADANIYDEPDNLTEQTQGRDPWVSDLSGTMQMIFNLKENIHLCFTETKNCYSDYHCK